MQTNSATAEQSAAASEELSGQANMLKELVGHFKLKENQLNSDFRQDIRIIEEPGMLQLSNNKY